MLWRTAGRIQKGAPHLHWRPSLSRLPFPCACFSHCGQRWSVSVLVTSYLARRFTGSCGLLRCRCMGRRRRPRPPRSTFTWSDVSDRYLCDVARWRCGRRAACLAEVVPRTAPRRPRVSEGKGEWRWGGFLGRGKFRFQIEQIVHTIHGEGPGGWGRRGTVRREAREGSHW